VLVRKLVSAPTITNSIFQLPNNLKSGYDVGRQELLFLLAENSMLRGGAGYYDRAHRVPSGAPCSVEAFQSDIRLRLLVLAGAAVNSLEPTKSA
jgi:hypothetical protein